MDRAMVVFTFVTHRIYMHTYISMLMYTVVNLIHFILGLLQFGMKQLSLFQVLADLL